MSFFTELKRRNIFKVAAAYVALGWVVVQVTDMAVPALNLPQSLNSIVFYLGLIGFPFAMFFAWAYELTPDGIKRSDDVEEEESITSDTSRKLEHLIVALLVIAVGFMIWDNYLQSPDSSNEIAQNDPTAVAPAEIGKSIAVLPFVNMSDDKDYFADGLSEELLNLLAKNRDLKVAGRTSSFAFKGQNADLREIGAQLDVATVLEGSVRRSGDQIRITAQLINVADGYHLWSDTYDRELVDIFDIQDEVAKSITDALQVTLGDEDALFRERPTENLEAYTVYLEAIATTTDTLQSTRISLAKFSEAVALDPDFVEAWIGRAVMAYNHVLYANRAPSESLARSAAYTQDALAVAPNSLYLHAINAATRGGDEYDWYKEIVAFNKAMEGEPNNAMARLWQIWSLVEAGYLREALKVGEEMSALDPLDPLIMTRYGSALAANGHIEPARELWKKAVTKGNTEAAVFYLVDRLRENDSEGAIEIFETIGAYHGEDYSAIHTLIEAEYNGQPLDADLAAKFDLGLDIRALFDLGRGRYDKFMDEIVPLNMENAISSADYLIYAAMAFPEIAITSHPRFIQFAEKMDMNYLWDNYGPPDMCSKESGEWVCE